MIGYSWFGGDGETNERGGRWSLPIARLRWTAAECSTTVNDRTLPRELPREIHRLPESRRQLIFRIRRELAEGVYETPEKLDIALDRMIDRHFADDVVG